MRSRLTLIEIIKKYCWLLIISAFGLLSCQSTKPNPPDVMPFYNTATFDAEWIDKDDPRYAHIHTISPFSLINQLGHTITKDSLDGHIYVANFFFSACPSICPKMMSNLKALQTTFADSAQSGWFRFR